MRNKLTSEMLNKKARSGWLWGVVEQFLQRGLAMMVSVVLARMLSPESFGLIASVSVFLTTAQQLIDGGIGTRIMQKKEILEEDYIAFFWCNTVASLLTCGILVVVSSKIAEFYGNPQLRSVVMALAAGIFLMNAGRTQEFRLIRKLQFKIISLVTIGSVVVGSIAGLSMAYEGCGVWAILGQQLAMSLVRAIAFWLLVPWRPNALPDWHAVKDLYAFGMPIMLSQTIRGLSEQLINVLTARYVGIAQLGYFDRGRFIPNNVANFISSIFLRTNLPVLSKLQHDENEFRKAYLKLMGTIVSVCMVVMTGLVICAPEIIEIILGPKWTTSVWFFRASCIMSSIYLLFLINLDVLKSKGAIASFFRQNMLYSVLQTVCVVGGLYWGIRGMMVGGIVACFLSNSMLMLATDQVSHISIRDQLCVFLRPILWALLTAVVLLSVKQMDLILWVRFLLCGFTGGGMLVITWHYSIRDR